MKKEVRLYNLIFPIYMLFVFPTPLWFLIIAANFLIDSLVVLLAAKKKGLDWRSVWKKSIVRVVVIGFAADFAGGALSCVLSSALFDGKLNSYVWPDVALLTLPGVILAGLLIYFLNKKLSFELSEPRQVRFICLMLAVFTAPYTMMLPFSV